MLDVLCACPVCGYEITAKVKDEMIIKNGTQEAHDRTIVLGKVSDKIFSCEITLHCSGCSHYYKVVKDIEFR